MRGVTLIGAGICLWRLQNNLPEVASRATLQWRHNGHDGVSDHQPRECFTQPFIQAQIKENIKAPRHWPVNSPHKGPVTRQMFLFDDVIMYNSVAILEDLHDWWL